jgi:hypothetical protein
VRKENLVMDGRLEELKPDVSVPLRGYLVREDDDRMWIQDREGTWIVDKADLQTRESWDGIDPRYSGDPVCVFIRQGAEIYEVRPYKIQLGGSFSLRNLQERSSVVGTEEMRAKEEQWLRNLGARHLGFTEDETLAPLTTGSLKDGGGGTGSMCCYRIEHADGAGTLCEVDDCHIPWCIG